MVTLPDEIWLQIFQNLDNPRDVARCFRLNRRFNVLLSKNRHKLQKHSMQLGLDSCGNEMTHGKVCMEIRVNYHHERIELRETEILVMGDGWRVDLQNEIYRSEIFPIAKAIASRLDSQGLLGDQAVQGFAYTMEIHDQQQTLQCILDLLLGSCSIEILTMHKRSLKWMNDALLNNISSHRTAVELFQTMDFNDADEISELQKKIRAKSIIVSWSTADLNKTDSTFVSKVLEQTNYVSLRAMHTTTTLEVVMKVLKMCYKTPRTDIFYAFGLINSDYVLGGPRDWLRELRFFSAEQENFAVNEIYYSITRPIDGRQLSVKIVNDWEHQVGKEIFVLQDKPFPINTW